MSIFNTNAYDHLINVSSYLPHELNLKKFIVSFVEHTLNISQSDLSCFYLNENIETHQSVFRLLYSKGVCEIENIFNDQELIEFIFDCRESLVLLERKSGPFISSLLHVKMKSSLVLPIYSSRFSIGVLILNSLFSNYYNREKIIILESITKIISTHLLQTHLLGQINEFFKKS